MLTEQMSPRSPDHPVDSMASIRPSASSPHRSSRDMRRKLRPKYPSAAAPMRKKRAPKDAGPHLPLAAKIAVKRRPAAANPEPTTSGTRGEKPSHWRAMFGGM